MHISAALTQNRYPVTSGGRVSASLVVQRTNYGGIEKLRQVGLSR